MLNEEIDFVQLSGTQGADISRFEAQSDKFDIQQFDQGRLFYLYVNPDAAGTQDAKVREALQYAFDRDAIVSGVYGGRASATTSIFPKDSRFYQENENAVSFNVEKAKSLLSEAGYTDTNNDGFVDKDGVNLKLHIVNYASNGFPTLSEVLQSQLKEIGVDSESLRHQEQLWIPLSQIITILEHMHIAHRLMETLITTYSLYLSQMVHLTSIHIQMLQLISY